jgi:hypothetical protein
MKKNKNKAKKNSKRKIGEYVKDIDFWRRNSLVVVSKKRIRLWKIIFVLAFAIGTVSALIFSIYLRLNNESKAAGQSVIMDTMKRKGCVADGLLSGYGSDTDSLIDMINRSECQYLHRAVETWANPPDFEKVGENLKKIKKPDLVIGMFLAEAINPKKKYTDEEGNKFDFSKMCREKSAGTWGENTCKADMDNKEYRKYLISVTKRAMDLGITSFLFGQVYMQEGSDLSNSKISEVIEAMKEYALKKGKKIIIGAQTNTIKDEKYLGKFDYIEGGVGESPAGHIDEGPCNDYYKEKRGGWCWAMLWNGMFSKKANEVILALDWNGLPDDDMSVYSRMDQEDRIKNLNKFYKIFTSKNIGFLMPFLAVINSKNPLCWGPTREFYAPDNKYSCQDEDSINAILKGTFIGNDARFISQTVPEKMIAGKKYPITVNIRNNGRFNWSLDKKYRLGSQNEQDNNIWGLNRIEMNPGSGVLPGQTAAFVFEITAPANPGTYNFQWQMVDEGIEWFGEKTPSIAVAVANS